MKLGQWLILLLVGLGAAGGGYFGYTSLTRSGAEATPSGQLATVQRGTLANTVSASGSIAMPRQAKLTFDGGGLVSDIRVKVGDTVKEGQILAQVDTSSLELAATQAKASVSTAQINLDKAQNPYTASDIADAEAAVRNAQVALESARRNVIITHNSPTVDKDVRDREYEVNWYEANYGSKLVLYQQGKISKDELDQAYSNLLTAKANLETARQKAADALAKAQNDVAKAQDSLRKAEEDLAKKQAGPDPQDVELKRIQLLSAQASLDQAIERLQQATLKAPFSGLVASVGANAGDRVGASTVVVQLVDPTAVEVQAAIDEIDLAKVKTGQRVSLILDALQNRSLEGTVTTITPVAVRQSGVVSYGITIKVNLPGDVRLSDGLTALADIIIEERQNVLMVPMRAVASSGTSRVVTVVEGEKTQSRVVATGLSNNQSVEITSGLTEGETVLVPTATTSSNQSQQGGFGAGFGGGLGGGGSFMPGMPR
ncbi:MAG: efflux RND transporter periplasmic adaptor subunit [Chloroflexi bacterium]|nr:efflux RND transporter periplasmic adaptor subunit [Chloroflexota bacterium]